MQLHFLEGIAQFQSVTNLSDRVQSHLLQHEAEHNLLLALLLRWIEFPDRFPDPPRLAVVEENGEILAIAFQTPPHKLVLSKCSQQEALTLIAEALAQHQIALPGVSGLVAEADHFVQTWHQLTGQAFLLAMRLRIHQLVAVQPIAISPGELRQATINDRPLLLKWYADLTQEAIPTFSEDVARSVDNSLKAESIYLWEDSQPVSLVSGRKALPAAGRIGPVYTPPEHRRKGYATACVAALSQILLDRGCERCFLFTDLTNPTSNHIYQTIGYQPLCDWHEYGEG
jgi:hypothetical protein